MNMVLFMMFLHFFVFLFKIVARFTAFVGDCFIVMLYSLVAWGLLATSQPLETYAQDLIDTSSLTFRIPLAALVAYLVLTSLIYHIFYRQVTTYSRWMYAFKVFLLSLFPIAVGTMVAKLAVYDELHLFTTTTGEFLGMIVGVGTLIFLGWVFTSLTYVLSEMISSSDEVASKSLVFWPQMYALLFKRKSDKVTIAKPPKRRLFRHDIRHGIKRRH